MALNSASAETFAEDCVDRLEARNGTTYATEMRNSIKAFFKDIAEEMYERLKADMVIDPDTGEVS